MNKKNAIFTGSALLVSCGAVVAGVLLTSNAMADGGTPAKVSLGVVSVGANGGDAFKCQFDDIDLSSLTPIQAMPVNAGGTPITLGDATGTEGGRSIIVGSGVISGPISSTGSIPAGDLPTLVVSGSATPVPAGDNPSIVVSTNGTPPPDGAPTVQMTGADGVVLISGDTVRDGTPEECAAMRPTTAPAP